MRIQSLRVFLFSSIAVVALTMVWGFNQIPGRGDLAEEQLRVSLEQELAVIRGAVKTAVGALTLKTLDVLKGEPEQSRRALERSTLLAAALAEWVDEQWKISNLVTSRPETFGAEALRASVAAWSLDKLAPEESYFTKVTELDGRAIFAITTRVRRGDQSAFAVGVFPANEFPLQLPADRVRDISVFDSKGLALALNHSAYVGANLRQHPLAKEILESDVVNVRTDWVNERRQPMLGLATRLGDSNLYAAIESRATASAVTARTAWVFLILSACGALALNWSLIAGLTRPLFARLASAEAQIENLRRLVNEVPAAEVPVAEPALAAAELPRVDFIEPEVQDVVTPPAIPLGRVVDQALRGLGPKLSEAEVSVDRSGLDDVTLTEDASQVRTVIEELVKNALEAMADQDARRLSISAQDSNGRIRLMIEDSGPGAPPEALGRVFEPFFSTRSEPGGPARGLGLNVVRRIIEAMGGSVTARNRVGQTGFACELSWPRGGAVTEVAQADLDLLADESDDFAVAPTPKSGALIRRPRVRTIE